MSETPRNEPDNAALRGFHRWLGEGTPALLGEPVVQGLVLIVLVTLFFLLFPGVDIWFSRLFYDPSTKFPMTTLGAFTGLRAIGNGLLWLTVAGLILVLIAKIAMPWRPSLVAPRDTLFILSTLLLGPGLIVNFILKDHWGRPRPWRVDAFGGDQPFVGVWRITHECATNCSFVSGEASSAIWLITLVVILPPAWRPLALRIVIGLAALLSLNRIAMGGHFLSDTLLSWAIMLTIIAAAWRFLYVSPPPPLANPRLEERLTALGLALRQFVGRAMHRPPPRLG